MASAAPTDPDAEDGIALMAMNNEIATRNTGLHGGLYRIYDLNYIYVD